MNGYFRPLRRKGGVITVAVACLLAGGWARSTIVADSFEFTTVRGGAIHQFASEYGAIQWRCCRTSGYMSPEWSSRRIIENPNGHFIDREFSHLILRYADDSSWSGNACRPYWLVVIPLTLLSASLLLSKPRSKPTATQQTVDATSHQNTQSAI